MRYLRKQADLHPDVVTLAKEGTTEEGRDIMLIKISNNSRADTAGCKAIWIDSGLIRDCTVSLTGETSVTGEIDKFHRCHR